QGDLRADVMVVMEKWASLDHLKKHLQAPHMDTYREQVKDLVTGVDLKVMGAA
ncbi:MAG: antibiotic biosynthesis monooxygenase, partial [Candidatus Hydrogenedentes bacterium]|nr:antibiotic biosynthesis monooxygenase [Candidatus Hydrogenedentota bacterium]